MMSRKARCCALCEGSNLASICPNCVNYRLKNCGAALNSLRSIRDSLYARLGDALSAKSKFDEQQNWKLSKKERIELLREKLRLTEKRLSQGKHEVNRVSNNLKAQDATLDSAFATLERCRVEQLEKFYPNLICTQSLGYMAITSERLHKQSMIVKQICKLFPQRRLLFDGERKIGSNGPYDQICGARLPRGLDPHSVPSDELSASLGYMVQLLNLVVYHLAAPALHNTGFAGSSSRIWQRSSYWNARPFSQSNEYTLFIPRQNFCSSITEDSWSDKSNFGVSSVESERKPHLDSTGTDSFNFSSASRHSIESHMDLQKGISLLKKSVACVTAYGYNSLGLEVPSDASTFEAFARLLSTLSSSKEIRSNVSLKMACSRHCKQIQGNRDKFACNANSTISSSRMSTICDNNLTQSAASFLFGAELADAARSESLAEGWDIVERPTFPPPPSQAEDIEHWTRAMIVDAT